ncbi:MAG: hypothetical protein BGO81_10320 [Devosia sp. 66-22]|nr:MAG: hypothetical protein BGO81_10320 [Devosia sp. 66-22]
MDTGERRSTEFSAEGTLAHSVSEAALFAGSNPADLIGRTFHADGFEFTPDEDFSDNVQAYVDFVRGLMALGYIILLETRVSPMIHWSGLPPLGIDLFGTADCIAFHPQTGKLIIVDLKFGRGIAVEATGNPQLLYYAAGAFSRELLNYLLSQHGYAALPDGWTPSEIETIVVQPRAYHPDGPIRRASYSGQEVHDWARGPLYQGVERAINDNGTTFQPGEHCRFCPALPHCKAAEKFSLDAAKDAFKNVPAANVAVANGADPTSVPTNTDALAALPDTHISDKKLGELLDKLAIIKPYFAALETLAADRLRASSRPGMGWKLVPTRPRRVWADDEPKIVAALHNAGLAPGLYTETRLRSPAQTERLLGKKAFKALMDQLGLVTSTSGGVTLAPEGDPRTRVQQGRSAQEAFAPTLPSPNAD